MKQVFIVRRDLGMSTGKIAVQVAHASQQLCEMAIKRFNMDYERWKREGAKKVVLYVNSKDELLKFYDDVIGMPKVLITDAGLTEVPAGTVTVAGFGPAEDGKMNRFFGSLPLL